MCHFGSQAMIAVILKHVVSVLKHLLEVSVFSQCLPRKNSQWYNVLSQWYMMLFQEQWHNSSWADGCASWMLWMLPWSSDLPYLRPEAQQPPRRVTDTHGSTKLPAKLPPHCPIKVTTLFHSALYSHLIQTDAISTSQAGGRLVIAVSDSRRNQRKRWRLK